MLSCQASNSLYRTQGEALCHQHKETRRSAQRIWIFFLVYRKYFSDASVGIQFYDFCLRCGNRSQIFWISCGHPLAYFSSSSSENLCAVNRLKVCTTKCITHVRRRFFIFRWQVLYLFTYSYVHVVTKFLTYERRMGTIPHLCIVFKNFLMCVSSCIQFQKQIYDARVT